MTGLLLCLFDEAIEAMARLEVALAGTGTESGWGAEAHREVRCMLEELVLLQEEGQI